MDETVLAEFAEASYSQKDSDNDAVRPVPSSDVAEKLEAVSEELKDVTREIAEKESEQTPKAKAPDAPATKKQGLILLFAQLAIYFTLALLCSHYIPATLLVSAFVIAGTALAILHGRRQLGGMSGDIAGYGIVWGELMGVIGLLFC